MSSAESEESEPTVVAAGTEADFDPVANAAEYQRLFVPHQSGPGALTFDYPAWRVQLLGGVMLGQALVAAARTVAGGMAPHALHGLFLQPATPPVRYEVEPLRDGRSFAARRVRALQERDGRLTTDVTVSFTSSTGGLAHQPPMPAVPMPDDCPVWPWWTYLPPAVRDAGRAHRYSELRIAARSQAGRDRLPAFACWMRPVAPLPPEPLLTAVYTAGLGDLRPGFVVSHHAPAPLPDGVILEQTVWWHALPPLDDWLLVARECPVAAQGRALIQAAVYTREGMRIASFAQEYLQPDAPAG